LETKELAAASQQCTALHFFFNQGFFFTKNNIYVVCHSPYLTWPPVTCLFPQLKIKLKGHHFDTTEVIEAESKEVLNTPTDYDFQDVFKKMEEALGTMHTYGRELLRV
jgi:hypothetical protein